MTTHFASRPIPKDMTDVLRRDPYLRQVYRARTVADLTAVVNAFGIADPEHRAAMLGLSKLAWVWLRKGEQ